LSPGDSKSILGVFFVHIRRADTRRLFNELLRRYHGRRNDTEELHIRAPVVSQFQYFLRHTSSCNSPNRAPFDSSEREHFTDRVCDITSPIANGVSNQFRLLECVGRAGIHSRFPSSSIRHNRPKRSSNNRLGQLSYWFCETSFLATSDADNEGKSAEEGTSSAAQRRVKAASEAGKGFGRNRSLYVFLKPTISAFLFTGGEGHGDEIVHRTRRS
jgi:hypothetical protein